MKYTNIQYITNMAELYKEYSGEEFNKYHKTQNHRNRTKFYKFLNNDLKHSDFTYVKGLNIDTNQFNPNKTCSKGGLYFCEKKYCHFYFKDYGTKLALIEIPDDARVYVEPLKFKADKLIVKQIMDFDEVDDRFWINIIPNDYHAFEYVKNKTLAICELAIRKNGDAIFYIKDSPNLLTNELCTLAVKRKGYSLRFIDEQYRTKEICILAVQKDGEALQFIKTQSDELCIQAVQQNGCALRYAEIQTEEICILAVQQNGFALEYVKKQTKELCFLAVQQNSKANKYVNEEFKMSVTEALSLI